MSTKSFVLGTTALVGGILGSIATANAQTDEIIITATKRQQTLQETPVAVSVTSEDTIEKAKILDINDLQTVVPSLRVVQLQSSQNTNFVIRGFGNGANNAGIEPSVGIFIDGVYRSRSAAQIGDLPVLERVEVLRGPQSTLFGKNASAGVISVVSAKPQYETEGYVEGTIGNYNQRILKGYFTTGLTDTMAISIGGGTNQRDGYFESLGGFEDLNNRNRSNIRVQGLYEPTDNSSFRLIADYSTIDEICCGVTNVQNQGAAFAIFALGGQLADADNPFAYETFYNRESTNEISDQGISFHADIDFENFTLTSITSHRSNNSFYNTDADYGSLELLETVFVNTDISTFTQEVRLTSTTDGQIDWMVGGFYFDEDIKAESGLEYGADLRNYIDILAGGAATLAGIEASNGIAAGTFFSDDDFTNEHFTQDNQALSLFGTLDFHPTERLTITAGVNYTKDEKELTGYSINQESFSAVDLTGAVGFNTLVAGGLAANFPALADAFGLGPLEFSAANVGALAALPGGLAAYTSLESGVIAAVSASDLTDPAQNPLLGLTALQFQPQFLAFPNSVESGKSDEDATTYTLRASYEVNDNLNVYASYATGWKAGSWNLSRDSRPFATDQAALEAAGLTQVNQGYGTRFALPEDSTVYEIGLKARFERGAINLAYFDQTLENFQSNIFLGTGFVLGNADEQSTTGLEVDITYNPVDPLTLTFAGTFLDPVYDSFPNASAGDLTGLTPAGVHEQSITASATYAFEVGENMSGYTRVDYLYESDTNLFDVAAGDTTAFNVERGISVMNASAGIETESGIQVSAYVRNLTDDQYFLSAFPGVAQAGVFNAYPSIPRTYGLTVRKNF